MIFLFMIAITFTLVGIILTLLVEWHYLNSFLLKQPSQNEPDHLHSYLPRYQLPKELKDSLDSNDSQSHRDACVALNLFFQFLYKELKDTKKVRRWFMKKLSIEFEELLQKTTTGKLIDQITLKDLILGTEFPLIKDFNVSNLQLHESKDYIQELDIMMNIEYSGGFQLSVSADLVWGRSAYLAVQVTRLNGKIRLQLTRQPFTHWSVTFCQEPVMEFKVESQFQGHPVPQVTSLIISQIRRAIKKKHTLPNYKVRFKPFFDKAETELQDMEVKSGKLTQGRLEVSVIECTRLLKICAEPKYYCTLAIDAFAWAEHSVNESTMWMTLDFEITKSPIQSIGIIFKQELIADKGKQCIIIDNINADSPANQVDLRKGDIVLTINGVKINSINQTIKLFKQAQTKFVVRVDRLSHLRASWSRESLSKVDEQVVSLKDFATNYSADITDDLINLKMNDESESLPTNCRTPVQGSPVKKILLSAHSGIFNRQKGNSSLDVPFEQRRKSEGSEQMSKNVQSLERPATHSNSYEEHIGKNVDLRKTLTVPGNPDPIWEEKLVFEVEDKHKYLNVGVWCQKPEKLDKFATKHDKECKNIRLDKNILVGQVSIPLLDVSMECATNLQGFHQQTFQFKPPELKPTASRFYKLSSHPGFDENLCYGDVTLVFIHKPQSSNARKDKRPSETSSLASESEDENDNDSCCGDTAKESLQIPRDHEFSGTQFKTATSCHYCGKKIWLKVAFQCKNCGMISHKKCVSKCQAHTDCTSDGAKLLSQAPSCVFQQVAKNPQIITTDAADEQSNGNGNGDVSLSANDSAMVVEPPPTPPGSPKTPRCSLPSLLANLANTAAAQAKSGLIRVGSAHNLAPPSQHFTTQSKSLPPSPQYSPLCSRKASLQGNLFPVLDEVEILEDVSLTVQRLLQHPNDEILVSAAKEMGKELFIGLEPQERKSKLNAMVKKVQTEIDTESENRAELAKCDRESNDPVVKTRLAFQLAKSDERSRALAVLLLHYFAGIQHCQELEENAQLKQNDHNDEEVACGGKETCPAEVDSPDVSSNLNSTSDIKM